MPSPPGGSEVYRVEQRHLLHGNAVWNVMHFITLAPITDTDWDDMAADALTSWAAEVLPTLSNELTLPECAVQLVFPTVGPLITVVGAGAGGVLADAVANQSAVCVTLGTLFPGRRARGRQFIGGSTEATFDGTTGMWTTTHANNMATSLNDYAEDAWATGRGLDPCIWSTQSAVMPTPQFYPVFNYIGRVIPASLRSRRIGRGI